MNSYFITFSIAGGGMGTTQTTTSLPIRSMKDIDQIQRQLSEQTGHSVVVTGWQRFEDDVR